MENAQAKRRARMTVLGSFLCILGVYCGTNFNNLMIQPMSERYSVSMAAVMVTVSLMSVAALILGIFFTQLCQKINVKILMIVGGLFMAIYLFCVAFAPSIYWVWGAAVLFGMTNLLTGQTMNQRLMLSWYKTGCAKLMTICLALAAACMIIWTPLASQLYQRLGMQSSAVIAAAVSMVFIVLGTILVSDRPEKYGLEAVNFGKEKEKKQEQYHELNMPVKAIMKMPALWVLLITHLLGFFAFTALASNQTVFLTGMVNNDMTQLANLITISTLFNMVVLLLYGFLADRIGAKNTIMTFWGISAAGWLIYVIAQPVGFAAGVFFIVIFRLTASSMYYGPTVIPSVFGRKKGGFFVGWSQTASSLASAVATPIVAAIAESGSYNGLLIVIMFILIIGIALTNIFAGDRTKQKVIAIDEKEYPAES